MREPDYAESFDKFRSQTTEYAVTLVHSILNFLPVESEVSVIDIGCGTGRYALLLASVKTGLRIIGTDLSRSMLEKARRKEHADRVLWCLSDAGQMPFANGSLDAALLFLVLHVVKDPKRILQEVHRILRPGGYCVILSHSHAQLDKQTIFSWFPEARKLNKKRMPSLTKLKDMLREIGFRKLRTQEFEESITYPRDTFLEKVRSKPNTSLRKISEADFIWRYKILEAALAGKKTYTEQNFSTLVSGQK